MSRNAVKTFSTARAEALGQHDELHRLLRTGVVLAGAAANGDRACQQELPHFIELVLGKLSDHLAFEEETLVPAFAQHGGFGVAAMERILAEHESQRRSSWKLLQLARSNGAPAAIASAFQGLHDEILADIANEEKWLLEADGPVHARAS
jgi:hypothetical protein